MEPRPTSDYSAHLKFIGFESINFERLMDEKQRHIISKPILLLSQSVSHSLLDNGCKSGIVKHGGSVNDGK